jgi:hypothetical protein
MIRPINKEGFTTPNFDQNGFRRFCQETSLPGWFYLSSDASKLWKIIWFIFLCLAMSLSSYVLLANLQQYQQVN